MNAPNNSDRPSTATHTLRDLVAAQVEHRWAQWSAAHPNLAQVIDRARLIDSAVQSLRSDPQFTEAMRQAGIDEAQLEGMVRVFEQVHRWVGRLMPL